MQRSDVKTTLRLDGPLTVAVSEAIKETILRSAAESRCVEIDVSGATDIDLSVLQIFLAARKMAKADGSVVTVLRDERLINEMSRCGIPVAAICHDAAL